MSQPPEANQLTVYTQNMAVDNGPYRQRYESFGAEIRARQPDIVAAQEVSNYGHGYLNELTAGLGGTYQLLWAPIYPGQAEQGSVIITNRSVIRDEVVRAPSGENDVQLAVIAASGRNVAIGSTHNKMPPRYEALRQHKMRELVGWLGHVAMQELPLAAHIIAGDFNAPPWPPFYRTAQLMEQTLGYLSASKVFHGKEQPTFPALSFSELEAGHYLKPGELKVFRVLSWLLSRYTLDYQFFKGAVRPVAAEVVMPNGHGPISDHYGLSVTYEVAAA
ncbi:MAG TPA: endonuclease/exonuclease/phosphatase family protein [Candidatus Saccharimonadales bacterium]|nr:endonuclease/exonuclease/phosphatase family protein [Candidatus Saccharimonadales bacterium]